MKMGQIFDLAGRVAIVSGGSVGLGRQMAEGLAEMGANLVLCARKKERCLQTAEELQQLGVEVLAMGCDVKDEASIGEVVDATKKRFGRIDVLINNAGTSWGAPVEEMTLAQWNKVVETNLTGTFLFSQAVGKVMIAQRRGKIINIASIAGLRGSPPRIARDRLQLQQRWSHRVYQGFGMEVGGARDSGERDCPWLVPQRYVEKDHRTASGKTPGLDPAGPVG